MMLRYVLGFAFVGDDILLIKKKRPEKQAGLYNGIGGSVESGELPANAMHREFMEETGIVTILEQWAWFGTIVSPHYEVDCFTTVISEKQMASFNPNSTDETVEKIPIQDCLLMNRPMVNNLAVLTAAALLRRNSQEPHLYLYY